jgi:AAA15 family ATPase/GTPase
MWIRTLELQNLRSFSQCKMEFSKGINVLIGPNNSGKSTILCPLLGIQEGLPQPNPKDLRLGQSEAKAEITFGDIDPKYFSKKFDKIIFVKDKHHANFTLLSSVTENKQISSENKIPGREPGNFIYPFLSKRKVTELDEQVNDGVAESVSLNFKNLNAKIDRLSNPEFLPAHELYMRACDKILGFRITSAHTRSGKQAVYTVRNMDQISLLAMGEGVMNILGLVVQLAIAEKQLFLIEEPENDVHPKALKALLDLIGEKSIDNQFIITTHSNIVVKRLGALPESKLFRVEPNIVNRMPTSSVTEIDASHESRREVLTELGYELNDVDLWDAWLFLEESSAEKIIREYLIPWFTPSLGPRLRTFSAHSISEVAPKFRDFNELFVFLHLEPTYKNKAWILVDGGAEEKQTVDQLLKTYSHSGWDPKQFRQLSCHDFEDYYPTQFKERVTSVKAIQDKKLKRAKKRDLLSEVEQTIADNKEGLKIAFNDSAAEVITILKDIEKSLSS